MNVANLLNNPVRDSPHGAAIIEGGPRDARWTTFLELDRRAASIHAQLQRDGVRKGDHILFFAPPSRDLYAALIAGWRLGAVAMFVEPSAGRATLDSACAMRPPAALIASPKAHLLRVISPALRRIARMYHTGTWFPGATGLRAREQPSPPQKIAEVAPDDAALLTFTSGSTGVPKGAIRTHRILFAQLEALRASVAASAGEREMVTLPIVVLLNLAIGVETVIPNVDLRRPGAIDPLPVREQLFKLRVTRITASPAFLERLTERVAAGETTLRPMTQMVTGGGPVFPDLVARLARLAPAASILSVYGSTEAEPIAHLAHRDVSETDHEAMENGAGLLAGVPDPAVKLRIVTPVPGVLAISTTAELDKITLGANLPGEIIVSGAHVVINYVNGIGESETKCRVDGVVWHRTGDLGYLDASGRLWLLGRVSVVAQLDGRDSFYPFAVECAARISLGVRRIAALTHDGRRVLVLERADGVSAERARERLAWAALDDVRLITRIPMDRRHNSKVDYPTLQRLLSD